MATNSLSSSLYLRIVKHVPAAALVGALLMGSAVLAAPSGTGGTVESQSPEKKKKKKKIKYRKRKQVDFGDTTIEGRLRRPEASLITAGETQSGNGLLRLREGFLDRFAADSGEELP